MLNIWNRQLDGTSQAAVVIISIALMLAGGFLLTRVPKRLRTVLSESDSAEGDLRNRFPAGYCPGIYRIWNR